MDALDLYTRSSSPFPSTFENWFDLDRWAADNGVARTLGDPASDVLDASNAYTHAYQDIYNSYYASQDPQVPAFDAFASSVASTSGCGWTDRDHVTSFGPDGTAPLPHPLVNPADICDVVPFVPPSASQLGDDDDEVEVEHEADDEEEPEDVAAAPVQPEFDMTNLQWHNGWFADIEYQLGLQAQPVVVIEELVVEYVLFSHLPPVWAPDRPPPLLLRPEKLVKPNAPRSCKRQRAPDVETYPARPKKSKCTHSPSAPSCTSRSATATLPEAIVVGSTTLYCTMPDCAADLAKKDGTWRSHFKAAHHKEVCTDSSCADAKSCKSARCPQCPDDAETMPADSLGRHILNTHIGVVYRCPVCGEQKPQRKFAIDRHIKMCFGKSLKAGRA